MRNYRKKQLFLIGLSSIIFLVYVVVVNSLEQQGYLLLEPYRSIFLGAIVLFFIASIVMSIVIEIKNRQPLLKQSHTSDLICPNCNKNNSIGSMFCNNCGTELITNGTDLVNDEANIIREQFKQKNKFRNKKVYISICVILCIIGSSVYGYFYIQQQKQKQYEILFLTTTASIVSEELNSALMCEEISTTWSNAINLSSYYYKKDFNEEIANLKKKWDNDDTLRQRKDAKNKIEENMKKLKDHPKNYEEAYKLELDLYDSYGQIYSQAINPTGSLITYNKNVEDKISEFNKIYDRLTIIKPDIKSTQKK